MWWSWDLHWGADFMVSVLNYSSPRCLCGDSICVEIQMMREHSKQEEVGLQIEEFWLLNQRVLKFWNMVPKFLGTLPINLGVYAPPLIARWPSDSNWLIEFRGLDPVWPLKLGHKRRCSFHLVCWLRPGALSHHVRSLTALRLPYCEETKLRGESTCVHSGPRQYRHHIPYSNRHQVLPAQVPDTWMKKPSDDLKTSCGISSRWCFVPDRPRRDVVETSQGVESRQNSWPMEFVSIIKWWLLNATKFGVLCYTASSYQI